MMYMFPDYREIILHRSRSGLGFNFVKNIQLKRRWRRKTGWVEFEEWKAYTSVHSFFA